MNPGSVLDLAVDLLDQLVIKGRFHFLLSSELTKTSLTYLIKHYDYSHSLDLEPADMHLGKSRESFDLKIRCKSQGLGTVDNFCFHRMTGLDLLQKELFIYGRFNFFIM